MKNPVRTVRHDPASRPFIVIWEATRACALACVHCRAEAQTQRDPGELTAAQAQDLMREVRAFGDPPPIFVITGGDPFERPDLNDLVRSGRELGLPMAVAPSATARLTGGSLADLHEAGANVISLSLDGATAAVHDGFRQVPGTFERTLAAWQDALDAGLKVQINTTLGPHNLDQLPEIVDLVHRRGALTWSVFLLVPVGRADGATALDAATVEDVLHLLYDIGSFVPVKTTEGHHFRRVSIQRHLLAEEGADPVTELALGKTYRQLRARFELLGLPVSRSRRPPLPINSGNGFVFIAHDGTVHPSGFLPIGAGNVRQQSLRAIYRDSDLFTRLRDPDQLTGRCGACEFRTVCGGSRSRAFATTGHVLAEDPLCAYEPGTFGREARVAELAGLPA